MGVNPRAARETDHGKSFGYVCIASLSGEEKLSESTAENLFMRQQMYHCWSNLHVSMLDLRLELKAFVNKISVSSDVEIL